MAGGDTPGVATGVVPPIDDGGSPAADGAPAVEPSPTLSVLRGTVSAVSSRKGSTPALAARSRCAAAAAGAAAGAADAAGDAAGDGAGAAAGGGARGRTSTEAAVRETEALSSAVEE